MMRIISQDNLIDIPYEESVLAVESDGEEYYLYAYYMNNKFRMSNKISKYLSGKLLDHISKSYHSSTVIHMDIELLKLKSMYFD